MGEEWARSGAEVEGAGTAAHQHIDEAQGVSFLFPSPIRTM